MKEKLFINKRLPYIKLPKEKIELFTKWYNVDLRDLEELPKVFEEGYLEIDTSDYISVKMPTIFDIKSEEKFNQLKELYNKVAITYSKMIIHFEIKTDNIINTTGYYGDGNYAFRRIEFNIKEDDIIKKIRQSVSGISDREDKYLPEINDRLVLDLLSSNTMEDMKAVQDEFNRKLGDSCLGLLISVVWYLATNKSEKYIVNHTQIIESDSNVNKKHNTKSRDRYIRTPIYELVDKQQPTIDKLIKRRNGWTISHSFQVRGHYRHYKNGKIVFIKSYKKGKELDNFENKTIILSPDN